MDFKNNLFPRRRALKVFFTVLLSLFFVSEASAAKSYKGYSKLPEPPATTKGESIYKESDCSMCHGEMGDGEGFLAAGLEPKPRDFTNFLQMNTVTDMSMINAIQDGLKGTAMPAHPDFNDEQIEELILYLRSLLAETYLTLNVCLSKSHVVDTGDSGLDLSEFRVIVDNPELINVAKEGKLINISTKVKLDTVRALMKKRVTRTHIKLVEKDNTVSIISVRIHRCLSTP
ncbi:MAG: cytochrome c [Nitrospina sp.]|nr:cytochrome c [Nitrospina sp.]MBT3414004.1 cytochrome c [Nitrospina sp.]MBT3855281.1 cytochrome c [Nitrospina sp.]MBT4105742.1 cytochrome c [Nitrospina sp.]MBT4389677.1 cytochrome c [Nitrospina sp.]